MTTYITQTQLDMAHALGARAAKRGYTGPNPFAEATMRMAWEAGKRENAVVIMGHTFLPMDAADHECFAGAPEEALICNLEHVTLIWDPQNLKLSEMYAEGYGQRDWCFQQITGEDRLNVDA